MLSSCRVSCLHPSIPWLTCSPLFPPPLPPSFQSSHFAFTFNIPPPSSSSLPFLLPSTLFSSLFYHLFLWPPCLPLPSPPLPPFIKCGCWLAGSSWLASGGGYSFIIPSRLPARLATMSQELNICHYYLLVLFDFEAAQWPVSAGFIPPPSVVHFKVDYSNPRARDSAKSWSFLSFAWFFWGGFFACFLSFSLPAPSS